jgi:hypothetical protein
VSFVTVNKNYRGKEYALLKVHESTWQIENYIENNLLYNYQAFNMENNYTIYIRLTFNLEIKIHYPLN